MQGKKNLSWMKKVHKTINGVGKEKLIKSYCWLLFVQKI